MSKKQKVGVYGTAIVGGGATVGRGFTPAARLDDHHCNAPAGLHHIRPLRGHLFDKV